MTGIFTLSPEVESVAIILNSYIPGRKVALIEAWLPDGFNKIKDGAEESEA